MIAQRLSATITFPRRSLQETEITTARFPPPRMKGEKRTELRKIQYVPLPGKILFHLSKRDTGLCDFFPVPLFSPKRCHSFDILPWKFSAFAKLVLAYI